MHAQQQVGRACTQSRPLCVRLGHTVSYRRSAVVSATRPGPQTVRGSQLLGSGLASRHFRPSPTVLNATSGQSGLSKWNPVDVVKREAGLMSTRLPADVRERVEGAVEELRFRVTTGDVAAKAGLKLATADEALKALAYDSLAALEVSEEGDVVYSFPRDFRATLRSRSLLLGARPLLNKIKDVAGYLARIGFGTVLVSSIAIVWLAAIVIMSSGSRDNDRDRRGYYNPGAGAYYGGGYGSRVYFNLTDLLLYLDPRFNRHQQERLERGAQLTFIESIFSFVFGDGDPNSLYDERRWQALGKFIQERGGVVTAEEMAPFLDAPALALSASDTSVPSTSGRGAAGNVYVDESFVLPALIRFGGEAFVAGGEGEANSGTLLYRFPALQRSGVTYEGVYDRVTGRAMDTNSAGPDPDSVPLEQEWELTAATPGQLTGVVGLGAVNVIGVLVLSSLLADPRSAYILAMNGLGFVTGLMPVLQAYSVSFFLIPLVRWFFNQRRNAKIAERNEGRMSAMRLLNKGARWLKDKIAAARREGKKRTLRKGDMVFATDKDTAPQANNMDVSEWDRRLNASNRDNIPGSDQDASSRPKYYDTSRTRSPQSAPPSSNGDGWQSNNGRGRRW